MKALLTYTVAICRFYKYEAREDNEIKNFIDNAFILEMHKIKILKMINDHLDITEYFSLRIVSLFYAQIHT